MSIRVNGVEIDEPAIAREVQNHPAPTLAEARRDAARALVVRELLLQEAARRGIDEAAQSPAEEAEVPEERRIRRLLEREVRVPEMDEATCRRYFENNRGRFRSPDLFEAAHILFAAAPEDAAAREAARDRATAAIAELGRHPGRFAELATALSDCPSAREGGRLGQVTLDDIAPEIATFLVNLEEGQLSPVPVMSVHGWHVLRLDRRVAGRELPYEAVAERIAGHLQGSVWRRAVHQYLQILVGQARIEGLDLEGAETPLVQ